MSDRPRSGRLEGGRRQSGRAVAAGASPFGSGASVRWGIGSYTYGWATGTYGAGIACADAHVLGARELIGRAAEARAPVVQIAVRPDLLLLDRTELADIAGLARGHRIELETGTSGTEPNHLIAYLRASEQLGARTIRTIMRGQGATIERAGNELASVLPAFERAGVRLAIENFEAFSASEHAGLLRRLGSRAVGSCIDTVNNLGRGEGTREVLGALLPWVFCLHLKDFTAIRSSADSGFEITGTPLGTGRLPVREVMDAVVGAAPDASIILEQWIPYQGSRDATIAQETEWARVSIEQLRLFATEHSRE